MSILKVISDRGAALVEMAVVLPVMVMFVTGIYFLQTGMYDKALLRGELFDAARGAVRVASPGNANCATDFVNLMRQGVNALGIKRQVTVGVREGSGGGDFTGNVPGSSLTSPLSGEPNNVRIVTFWASIPLCPGCPSLTVSRPFVVDNFSLPVSNNPYCGGPWPQVL